MLSDRTWATWLSLPFRSSIFWLADLLTKIQKVCAVGTAKLVVALLQPVRDGKMTTISTCSLSRRGLRVCAVTIHMNLDSWVSISLPSWLSRFDNRISTYSILCNQNWERLVWHRQPVRLFECLHTCISSDWFGQQQGWKG